jgi:hypothetical protein
MREPDYRGLAALVIAVSGAFGIFVVVPLAVLMGYTLGEAGSDVMIALGGALVGAFAVYMGMKDKESGNERGNSKADGGGDAQ